MSRRLDGVDDELTVASLPVSAYPYSVALWALPDANATLRGLWTIADKDVTNHYQMLELTTADVLRFGCATGGAQNNATAAAAVTEGAWNHCCATATSATARAVYLNGGNKGTSVTSRLFPTTPDLMTLGRWGQSAGTEWFPGNLADVALWNVALTDAEVAALSRGAHPLTIRPNAVVFYAPLWGTSSPELDLTRGRRNMTVTGATVARHAPVAPLFGDLWVPAGTTANAYELDCQPGAFTVTGTAATTAAGRVFDAAAGSYAVTGAAATTARGLFLSCDPTAYTVTGTAASPVAGRLFNAAPGTFSVTGSAATTAAGRVFTADPGTYTISGVAATLVQATPGVYVLSADPGAYTLTGTAMTPLATRLLSALPGTFTVNGTVASLGRELSINAVPATYTLTGVAVTFATTRALPADPGAFAITGAAADLRTEGQEPNFDEINPGWIAGPNAGGRIAGGGANGRIRQARTGGIG